MATRSSTTLFADNGLANFRAWTQFIEDTHVATGGWVVTGDTGQTAPGSLAAPTTTNQVMGYRIYRMADTLQATSPVYVKWEYGSGNTTAQPSWWLTVGTGSDGAGTITGIRYVRFQFKPTNASDTTTANNNYGSADAGRVQFALWIQSNNNNFPCLFSLERTKAASGADIGDGLLLSYSAPVGSSRVNLDSLQFGMINLVDVNQPSIVKSVWFVLPPEPSTGAFNQNVGVSPTIHFAGTMLQPGLGLMWVKSVDFFREAQFAISMYGQTRTYQHLGTTFTPYATTNDGSNYGALMLAQPCIRFD